MPPRVKSQTRIINLALTTNDVTKSTKSFQLSKVYVKRFLKIGILNIIYRRIGIPETEFESKNYESVSYVVFKRKSTNKFIRNYHVFAQGILEAIEKDYLKEIFMYIIDKKTDEILETYNFKIKYNKELSKSNTQASKVKNATVQFLEALANIPGKKRWSSDDVELFVELSYNDDTPSAYEPPNFEATREAKCLKIESKGIYQLGSVNTGFHKITSWGRGKNFTESPTSISAPSALVQDTIDELECIDAEDDHVSVNEDNDDTVQEEAKNKKIKLDNTDGFINLTGDTHVLNVTIESSEEYISCMCKWGLSKDFETTRCSKCRGIVHLACHGYITLSSIDESNFKCYQCCYSKNNNASLNMLIKLRIILYGIYIKNELPDVELQLASKEEKEYILGQLDKFGVYSSQAKSTSDINISKLPQALLATFSIENSQFFE